MSRGARMLRAAAGLTVALIVAAGLWAGEADAGASRPATVQLRGVVYTFDNQTPIAGARVRIAELPGRSAVTRADGSYELEVPDGTLITPAVAAAGHHGIHLQTFVSAGRNLDPVNFQIPTDGTYAGLGALLGVDLDPEGNAVNCAIVSTFTNQAVRDLGFREFVAFGAHGVAGATAFAEPALGRPIYFNESVIPDRSKSESSVDGGVIWTEVPPGPYRVSGRHRTARFADFVATCRPGRLVNANPPQGLYELRAGEMRDRRVSARLRETRVVRRGGRYVVRVTTSAAEYVSVSAGLSRRGRRLAAGDSGARVGGYAPGTRRLSLRLPRGVGPRGLKLVVRFADANANERRVVRRLRHGPVARPGPKANRPQPRIGQAGQK